MSANAAAADLYFVLAPQMSDRVLSCLGDPTDVAGLIGQASTSGGSLKFLIDNARMQDAGSACDAAYFANDPNPDLQEGLGELTSTRSICPWFLIRCRLAIHARM